MTDPDISLIDNTVHTAQTDEDNNSSDTSPSCPSRKSPSKRLSRGSVREGLARRKYAKWQFERFTEEEADGEESTGNSDKSNARLLPRKNGRGRSRSRADAGPATEPAAGGDQVEAEEPGNRTAVSGSTSSGTKPQSEIDILYENQRGWFFFGIPLYSRQSLLNLDPAGWETKDYKPSPVDITNAQLPDPSWEWVWKTWYVDMSDDVDEEGWQYSFSFSSKFAWHGTQPWFHSFVRRRRWLRKRAKRKEKLPRKGKQVEISHMLDDEYFTIHPSMLRSRESSAEPASAARSSSVSRRSAQQDGYLIPGEIGDILALMKCLKSATIDREKIDMVKQFVAQGGDNLFYLGERIPDIMSFFIFQNSRRQLINYLQNTADEISQKQGEDSQPTDQEAEAEARKLKYLRKAIEVAETHIVETEYWSDVRASIEGRDNSLLDSQKESTSSGKAVQYDGSGFNGFVGNIQGIPKGAGVGVYKGLEHLYSRQ